MQQLHFSEGNLNLQIWDPWPQDAWLFMTLRAFCSDTPLHIAAGPILPDFFWVIPPQEKLFGPPMLDLAATPLVLINMTKQTTLE